jgi:hypothetical protein
VPVGLKVPLNFELRAQGNAVYVRLVSLGRGIGSDG